MVGWLDEWWIKGDSLERFGERTWILGKDCLWKDDGIQCRSVLFFSVCTTCVYLLFESRWIGVNFMRNNFCLQGWTMP